MLWFVLGVNEIHQKVQVFLGRNRYYKSLWKEKETNSPSLLYYLNKYDSYISNLFLGIQFISYEIKK